LRAPTAMYDSDTSKDTPKRGPCTEGTRVQVLERIRAWAIDNSPSSPPIFWLSGMAGTGKSTIAYTVCRSFDWGGIHHILGASFFCSRQVEDLRRLSSIIPTLVYQLARHSSSFAKALFNVNRDDVHDSAKHISHLLVQPWRSSLKDRPDDRLPTLIVIDALDEIVEDGGPKLLRSLIEMMAEVGPSYMHGLKILITSRPHPDIVYNAQSLSREATYRLEDIDRETDRDDVMKFIVDSLPELWTSYRNELYGLADLSNGLFIYAATVIRLISRRDFSTKQKAERISVILREQNTRPLRGETRLPIDNIYADILDESIRLNHPDEISSFRLTALHGILCALRPLSILELADVISKDSDDIDPEAVRLLVDDLHAVTYISNDRIYTHHQSFPDYMFDEQRCGPHVTCRPGAIHPVLAQGCFRIMKQSLRFNICSISSSYCFDSELVDLPESITRNITSITALEYACRYWPSHLKSIPTESESALYLLHQLLAFSRSEKVLFWIEVMNLLSIKMECYNGMGAVMEWQFEAMPELQLALKSVFRVIRSFLHTPASLSTPHLYISSLAADLASNSEMPREWGAGFSGLPRLRFVGVSNHGGVLMQVDVGAAVQSVAFSADGQHIVSGSNNEVARIWDASTGKELKKLEGHTASITSVAFSIDGQLVVSGSVDKSVRIWNVATGEELHKFELEGHVGRVTSVTFSADGNHVVSGSSDKLVRIWDITTENQLPVKKLHGHTRYVTSVAFSADGQHVVSGSYDESVRIWDAFTGMELQRLEGHTGCVTSVTFSADSQFIASGSSDKSVAIWDVSIGKELQKLEGHAASVTSVAFSADRQRVVSGSSDESVRIWDTSAAREQQKLQGHTDSITSVAFAADGQHIISGSYDKSVRIWDAYTGKELQKLGHTASVTSVAFSPDNRHVISGSSDKLVHIWDVSTGEQLQMLEGHTEQVNSVAFSADSQHIVSGSSDQSVRIWDAFTGEELQVLEGHTASVTSVTFSTDGHLVASGSSDKFVRIWDISTGEELKRLEGHTQYSVRIWDVYTGDELQILEGHTASITSVAFSEDSRHVISGSDDKSVRLWDALTGKQLRMLKGHTDQVTSIAFSTGSPYIVSGSSDKSVRIWDTSTRKETHGIEWKTNPDGWLLSTRSKQPLVWIPTHLHPGLCDKDTLLIMSQNPYTTIDFSSACLGTNWMKCYTERGQSREV
ncbi:WD40 repeat-like protein, partial [Stereum hirsutum FP-91666 SS1]|uniref:WD40 repeat-like protein n=1 Tax=Stereum hirsutum (strain FP-91666) TaxID=721885 RepID=UPI0004449841